MVMVATEIKGDIVHTADCKMIAIDQYGAFYFLRGRRPRKELMDAMARKHAEKLVDDGQAIVGYRIANRDFRIYALAGVDFRSWKPERPAKAPRKSRAKKPALEVTPMTTGTIKAGDKISYPGHELDGAVIRTAGKGSK